jgi:ATP-dependent protease ClpP protease subunit
MRIAIDGIVGLEVLAEDIRAQLDEAGGEDIDLTISSPGGAVYEGIAIYNALRDYKREGGRINARVVGLAASMATYIPMAADTVSIEDNAVWMVHNPLTIAIGNQNDMRKQADILDGIAGVLASAYAKKTGKEVSEIRELMDDETYLFGEDITEYGFADSIEPAGEGAEDKSQALALAQNAVNHMEEKMREATDDIDSAAAMLNIQAQEKAVVDRSAEPASEAGNKTEVPMTIEELKKENPDLYAQISNEGKEAGIDEERKRVTKLRSYVEADPDNVKLAEVINTAIADGSTAEEIDGKIQVAIRDGGKFDGENPPSVETTGDEYEGLSDDDKEAIEKMDISVKEYRELVKEVK